MNSTLMTQNWRWREVAVIAMVARMDQFCLPKKAILWGWYLSLRSELVGGDGGGEGGYGCGYAHVWSMQHPLAPSWLWLLQLLLSGLKSIWMFERKLSSLSSPLTHSAIQFNICTPCYPRVVVSWCVTFKSMMKWNTLMCISLSLLLCLELVLKQPLSEKYVLQSTMQLPAILCIIIIRFKRLENCEGLRSRVWVILLTCKSCLAASAPALVLKVTKPTGCKERNSHELSLLDLIFSTIVKGPVCVMSKSCKRTLLRG